MGQDEEQNTDNRIKQHDSTLDSNVQTDSRPVGNLNNVQSVNIGTAKEHRMKIIRRTLITLVTVFFIGIPLVCFFIYILVFVNIIPDQSKEAAQYLQNKYKQEFVVHTDETAVQELGKTPRWQGKALIKTNPRKSECTVLRSAPKFQKMGDFVDDCIYVIWEIQERPLIGAKLKDVFGYTPDFRVGSLYVESADSKGGYISDFSTAKIIQSSIISYSLRVFITESDSMTNIHKIQLLANYIDSYGFKTSRLYLIDGNIDYLNASLSKSYCGIDINQAKIITPSYLSSCYQRKDRP